jgi:hypothetical protein
MAAKLQVGLRARGAVETQHHGHPGLMMGFAALNSSYELKHSYSQVLGDRVASCFTINPSSRPLTADLSSSQLSGGCAA